MPSVDVFGEPRGGGCNAHLCYKSATSPRVRALRQEHSTVPPEEETHGREPRWFFFLAGGNCPAPGKIRSQVTDISGFTGGSCSQAQLFDLIAGAPMDLERGRPCPLLYPACYR